MTSTNMTITATTPKANERTSFRGGIDILGWLFTGGLDRNRTCDPSLRRALLYLLSHEGDVADFTRLGMATAAGESGIPVC